MKRRTLFTTAAAAAVYGLANPGSGYAASSAECPTDPALPKRQLRAMWIASVTNIDWPSATGLDAATQRAEYLRLLDEAQAYRLNAVFVQVRPTADAFWPSPLEPWSQWLTGRQGGDPGYDPLAFLVEEAHKRNLEFHAWFNPYRVSMQGDPGQLVPQHPARQHPEWIFTYGSRLYYNPGIPEVRRFIQDAIMHAVEHYDIDGVHFDDYFYPYPVSGETLPDEDTFAEYGAGFDNIHDWRRNNVNLLVQEMHDRIHAVKPWVKFGISPFGIWRNQSTDPLGSATNGLQSYDEIYADSRRWVLEGWVDYINPQVYWEIGLPVANYAVLVPWWANVVSGTDVHLYIGQAAYKVGTSGQWLDPAELSRHITFNRDYPQVKGDVYFSARSLRANPLGAVDRLVSEQYSRPALIPVIEHLGGRPPAPPVITTARRTTEGVTLSFRSTATGRQPATDRAVSYAIYRFDGQFRPRQCDLADARHLIGTVRADRDTGQFIDTQVESGRTYTYVATALSRLHRESGPSPSRVVRA